MVLCTIIHLFKPEIQWCQYQRVIAKFHKVIKASRHPEDSSRLMDKCNSQISMTPSRKHFLFSLTVFLKANTGSSFSRDIQEVVPNQFVKCQCSINPPWQPHSFNTVGIHQDLYFNHKPWEDHSTKFISQFGKVYIPSENQYRSAASLKE
ncbi:hypothetical protein O181_046698 [Austropuccinia psidii MF-1]|uniref:Uncharacterized protein n=1 Tax=Austropuccinia psidii MF-1 TaxID=1389203 RepID=A0A9Q3DUM0_9BASI|nr:hypothetical protein [Austropuccinia psidii MF-1]